MNDDNWALALLGLTIGGVGALALAALAEEEERRSSLRLRTDTEVLRLRNTMPTVIKTMVIDHPETLVGIMEASPFDSKRDDLLEAFCASGKKIKSKKAAKILASYSFGSNRYEAALKLLRRLKDPENSFRLAATLSGYNRTRFLREASLV